MQTILSLSLMVGSSGSIVQAAPVVELTSQTAAAEKSAESSTEHQEAEERAWRIQYEEARHLLLSGDFASAAGRPSDLSGRAPNASLRLLGSEQHALASLPASHRMSG